MGRHKIIKPNVATVNPMNIGLATVIPLNDEGRTFLVDQVYQRRIMWDRTHPDFARHNERKRAMEEIREALLVNGWIQAKIPLHKVKNTISMLKACYRTKKKKGQFEKHADNCQWLRKIDTFMADSLAPYKANEKRLGPGGLCSLEDHMKILNFYKNHELLWNPKHPDYHDRPMHAEVWSQCEAYINKDGMTAEICKKISKTLRIRYVNRRKVMSLADVDQYSQHLEWFRVAESFLGPLLFPISKPKLLPLSESKQRNFSSIEDNLPVYEEISPLPKNMRTMNKDEKYAIYLRFMSLYHKMEVLWNHKHPNYGCRQFRRKAWSIYAQRINIRHITPSECRMKIKRIRAAYVVRRRTLTPEELELVFLQPEWFVICETILGARFITGNELISEEEDEPESMSEVDESEEEVEKLLAVKHKKKSSKKKEPKERAKIRATSRRVSPVQGTVIEKMKMQKYPTSLQEGNPQHTDEIRLRIISAYKYHELLWDTTHHLYTATARRHQYWNDITDLINVQGLTVEDIKHKVQEMRRLFKQLHKSGDSDPKPAWFVVMASFLQDALVAHEHKGLSIRSAAKQKRNVTINSVEINADHFPVALEEDNPGHVDEVRLRIISAYKHSELLWDQNHSFFKEADRRQESWATLVKAVNVIGLTVEAAKEKVQEMRNMFKALHSDPETVAHPVWFYVIESFLKYESRKVRSRMRGPSPLADDEDFVKHEYDTPAPIDVFAGPEFVATEVVDEIKKEEDDTIIQIKPAPAQADNCRGCLQEFHVRGDSLKCLKNTSVDGIPLCDIYNEVVGSAYHDSDAHLPEAICSTCFQAIVKFNNFQKKCLANEKQYLIGRSVYLLEKSKMKAPKRQHISDSDNDGGGGSHFQDGNASDDSFSWEDNLPLKSRKELMKRRKPSRRRKKLIREVVVKPAPSCKEAEALPPTPQHQVDPEKLLTENFDVNDIDLDSFFDNNANESDEAAKKVTKPVEKITTNPVPVLDYIEKHEGVIQEVVNDWVPRPVKKKPPEQKAKEEEQFAEYLKEMLEKANENPLRELQTEKKKYHYDNQICTDCGLSVQNMYQHKKIHQTPENLFCQSEVCRRKKPFKNRLQLHQHMVRVHREQWRINKCDFCQIDFASRKERAIHMKTQHPEYRCDVCNRVYKTHYLMMIHRNAVHIKERNEDGTALQCDICQKEFKNYTLMNQHRRRTHMAKEHECDKCIFTARTKFQLNKHIAAKHPPEGAEKYTCHLCDKKFAHLHFLKNHFLTRHSSANRYPCEACPRIFRMKESLSGHYSDCHPDFQPKE